MLMGCGCAKALSGMGAWNNQTQSFDNTQGIATGCWDPNNQVFTAIPSGGCNSQILYTNDGVLPAQTPRPINIAHPPPVLTSNPVVTPVVLPPNIPSATPTTSQTTGTTAAATTAASGDSVTAFLEQNWMWIAGGVGALLLLATIK